jgi:hypothetical protein
MSITEKYIEQQNARRGGRAESEEPERKTEGPTTKEILANKDLQDLFADYLETEDAKDLGVKLGEGTLEGEDFAELEEKRKGFLEILDRSKSIMESLDSRTIEKLVASSPDLQTIAGAVGKEGIRTALSKHMPRVAIKERQRFIDLEAALGKMAESKKKIDQEDLDIQKWCRENGVSESEYIKLLQTGDTTEILEGVRSQYGLWQKLRTNWKKLDKTIFDESLENADAIEKYWKNYDRDVEGVGSLLQSTMMENPLIKETLIADLKKDTVEKKDPNMSFGELKDAIQNHPINKQELDAALDAYRKGHPGMDEDELLHGFSEAYANDRPKKKSGFWSKIFTMVFASNIEHYMKKK